MHIHVHGHGLLDALTGPAQIDPLDPCGSTSGATHFFSLGTKMDAAGPVGQKPRTDGAGLDVRGALQVWAPAPSYTLEPHPPPQAGLGGATPKCLAGFSHMYRYRDSMERLR